MDAVVYDMAVLQHAVTNDGSGELRLVGTPFQPQQYGFIVRADDPFGSG